VIGVADEIKGQIPKAFVVLKSGAQIDAEELRKQIVALVRKEVGPVASLNEVVMVPGLPKTRSGKVLRKTMRGIADGKHVDIPSTIEDASILDILRPLLRVE
jgi:propionyl-CoA synthetase